MLGQAFDNVLLAARAGAGWAHARLYEDLAGVVTGYLRQQGAAEPDDVASETFLHVFDGLDGFEGDEDDFRSWVFTIAHRRLIDERRARSRRPATVPMVEQVDTPTDPSSADEAVMDEAQWAQLERNLGVLTPLQRDVVLLRVVAGLTVTETAAVVDRSEDAVRQLQHRGLRALERRLTLPDRAALAEDGTARGGR